jgi:hypothetical protein
MYEPYVVALGDHLMMHLPAWIPPRKVIDNWQTSAWERSLLRFDEVRDAQVEDVH